MDGTVTQGHDPRKLSGDYAHEDPVVDAALDWFGRLRDAGTGANGDLPAQFRRWLAQDPRHEVEFRKLEAMWGSPAFLAAVRQLPPHRRPRRWAVAAVAASVVLALGIWQYPGLMLAWRADYLTVAGERTTVDLPDGSTMVLNTRSAVAINFRDGARRVQLLQGEAWFDVRHDPQHPFRVAGGFGEAVVKGTSFSVRREDDRDEIILERGRVDAACLCATAEPVALLPGEAVDITDHGPRPPAAVDPERALAWREGRLVFRDAPLGDVLAELARYTDAPVFVANRGHDRMLVTGNYRLDNIADALRTLADTAGMKVTRLPGGTIILR